MSISKISSTPVPIHIWSPLEEVESQAIDQLKHVASLPWVFHHVAAMADVHLGVGATVGSVIAMKGAVSPAAVGVDIGCGMAAIRTNLRPSDLPENLEALRHSFERSVPVGFNVHDDVADRVAALDIWKSWDRLDAAATGKNGPLRAMKQIGTLGGGNHFIELCISKERCITCGGSGQVSWSGGLTVQCQDCDGYGHDDRVWLMLHSGSRNIGKELAEKHIAVAQKLIHNQGLPDRDLAVFLAGTPEMQAYRHDLFWAQEYAWQNRLHMLELLKKDLVRAFPTIRFDTPIVAHHNYVSEETHFGEEVLVTRKGAIRAGRDELGIIPGSMGTKSYIVRGLGCEESFCSASHGAGRRMSRGAAKRTFTVEDLAKQTEGVCCRKDQGIVDEIPGAYKDIDRVMANQKDLVEIVAELKQVLVVKG